MDKVYKEILFNSVGKQGRTISPICGKVRLDASGNFTYLSDSDLVWLCGKFYVQFNVPVSTSGVCTFTEVAPFNAGNTTVVTVDNNDTANSARFIVEIEGCFSKAVISGASVTAEITFIGYAMGYST
ncbi:MAG: hypothetical protein JXB49_30045 [Bacteroidales bacterium]|nr:hypothetical protein [Bacteroidales bacterium]